MQDPSTRVIRDGESDEEMESVITFIKKMGRRQLGGLATSTPWIATDDIKEDLSRLSQVGPACSQRKD